MNRIWLLLAIACVAVGCGRKPELSLGEFAPYVHEFERLSVVYGNPSKIEDLVMSFDTPDSPQEQGWCRLSSDKSPYIGINRTSWDLMDETERKLLVFHELGHCIKLRKHTTSALGTGEPASLMNPYSIDAYTYSTLEGYYLQELFTGQ